MVWLCFRNLKWCGTKQPWLILRHYAGITIRIRDTFKTIYYRTIICKIWTHKEWDLNITPLSLQLVEWFQHKKSYIYFFLIHF
jgi:hypothetical protein